MDLWGKHVGFLYFKEYYIAPCPTLPCGQLTWRLLQVSLSYFTEKWQNGFVGGFTLISTRGAVLATRFFSQLCSKTWPNSPLVFPFPSVSSTHKETLISGLVPLLLLAHFGFSWRSSLHSSGINLLPCPIWFPLPVSFSWWTLSWDSLCAAKVCVFPYISQLP